MKYMPITDQRTMVKRERRKQSLLAQGAKLMTRHFLPLGQDSLETMLAKCDPDSKIEEIFLLAAYDRLTCLGLFCAQYEVLRYRLDFALLGRNFTLGVECDGFKFHGGIEQLSATTWRDIDLMGEGWGTIHFWGKDIRRDVDRCVEAVERLVRNIR